MLGRPHHIFSVIAIFIGVVLWGAIYFSTGWHPYIVWLIAWGVTTFIMYGFDKFQAWRQGLRVSEFTLHGLALVGGVLGGWAGMALFRHKVRHISFWTILVLSMLIHAALVYLWPLKLGGS